MKLHVLQILRQPVYFLLFIGSAVIVFDLNYYLMSALPGSRNEMCVMGINLTPENILFGVVISLLTGLMIAGLFALFAKRGRQKPSAAASLSGVGLGVGALTTFCPICALPLVSVTGTAFFFQLFNDYNFAFKILSLVLLLSALFMLNRKLSADCRECTYVPTRKP